MRSPCGDKDAALDHLVYGVFAYLLFLASFLDTVGFVGGFVVPKTFGLSVHAPVIDNA